MAGKIRFLRGKTQDTGTTMVSVTLADGGTLDITGKEAIECAIIQNNTLKFQQSHQRPFYNRPLNWEFGYKGTTMAASSVLAGLYDPDTNVPTFEKLLLEALHKPDSIQDLGSMPNGIPLMDYKRFWCKARENTSSYPDALSFSTMKAGSLHDRIATIECTLTSIPIKNRLCPTKWKHCVDVMILKKSGSTALDGLRMIVLFQVDYNYLFEHIGR